MSRSRDSQPWSSTAGDFTPTRSRSRLVAVETVRVGRHHPEAPERDLVAVQVGRVRRDAHPGYEGSQFERTAAVGAAVGGGLVGDGRAVGGSRITAGLVGSGGAVGNARLGVGWLEQAPSAHRPRFACIVSWAALNCAWYRYGVRNGRDWPELRNARIDAIVARLEGQGWAVSDLRPAAAVAAARLDVERSVERQRWDEAARGFQMLLLGDLDGAESTLTTLSGHLPRAA
jgi:hypothetical protein